MKQATSRILLFTALLFSHFIVFNFNLNNGFEPKGIKFQLMPLIQFAGHSSDYTTLTSVVIGYILFTIFLFANFKRAKASSPLWYYIILFLSLAAVIFELYGFILDYNNSFTGQRLRIGLLLFLMCYNVFNNIYKKTST